MDIKEFRGKYYFLSNFFSAPIKFDGISYLNNEAAFQSMKCRNPKNRLFFSTLNPSHAKAAGRRADLRQDWEEVKDNIMYEIVKAKFKQNNELYMKLLQTEGCKLEEGNTWNDTYWGVCNGRGKNMLGKILMKVRDEFLEYEYKEEVR